MGGRIRRFACVPVSLALVALASCEIGGGGALGGGETATAKDAWTGPSGKDAVTSTAATEVLSPETLGPPILGDGSENWKCYEGMVACADAKHCCPGDTKCVADLWNTPGCMYGYCCVGCAKASICGLGCCNSGDECVDGASPRATCGAAYCCAPPAEPTGCPAGTPACPPGMTCGPNHSALDCGGTGYVCSKEGGIVACPGEVMCPTGIDFCPAGTSCQGFQGVCAVGSHGSSGQAFCCKPGTTTGVTKFDGSYTGTYDGSVSMPGAGTYPLSGPMSLSIANGTITITAPGSGQGTVAEDGSAAFGGGEVSGTGFTFSGTFVQEGSQAIGNGSWTATGMPEGGTAGGTWTATRQ